MALPCFQAPGELPELLKKIKTREEAESAAYTRQAEASLLLAHSRSLPSALPTSDEYMSYSPASGVKKRAHNARCASGKVEGARREGNIWRCSRAAWHASFEAEQASRRIEDPFDRALGGKGGVR